VGFLKDVVCSSAVYAQRQRGGMQVGTRCVAVYVGEGGCGWDIINVTSTVQVKCLQICLRCGLKLRFSKVIIIIIIIYCN
jgi:hypothetical protein